MSVAVILMEDILTCPVCLELFNMQERVPLVLSCGHTLCRSCVQGISAASHQVQCPHDRLVDARPLNALTRNFLICEAVDQQRKLTPKHLCTEHKKTLKLYCRTPCGQLLCSKCLLEDHQGHQVVDYRDEHFVSKVSESMHEHVQWSSKLAESLASELTHLEDAVSSSERRKEVAKQQIRRDFTQVANMLARKAEQMLQDLEMQGSDFKAPIMTAGYQLKLQYDQTLDFKRQLLGLINALPRVSPESRLGLLVQLDSLIANKPDSKLQSVCIGVEPTYPCADFHDVMRQVECLCLSEVSDDCRKRRRVY